MPAASGSLLREKSFFNIPGMMLCVLVVLLLSNPLSLRNYAVQKSLSSQLIASCLK